MGAWQRLQLILGSSWEPMVHGVFHAALIELAVLADDSCHGCSLQPLEAGPAMEVPAGSIFSFACTRRGC